MANPRKPIRSSQAGDLAGSDFLFHLYRGAELLQENQVHEAKGEIENALRMQPREPQGQDLLAQVYFRLGLYPRAIEIYESLADAFPDEIAPRVNLALCYLKTGQPERARDQLERVVTIDPERQRAWGYLGLAFERIGDYEKARAAFERAGYRSMARRMDAVIEKPREPAAAISDEPHDESPELAEVRIVAEAAFHELDATDDAFSLALPTSERPLQESGSWVAVELGHGVLRAPPSRRGGAPARSHTVLREEPIAPPQRSQRLPSSPPAAKAADAFARESTLVFPREGRAARHSSGMILVTVVGEIAARLDLIQSMTTAGHLVADNEIVWRTEAGQEVPLGGPTRPLTIVEGARQLVLRGRPGRGIHVVELTDQHLFVREESLACFDVDLHHTHGRLASGYGDTIALVHLHGRGLVGLELPDGFAAVETTDGAGCVLRCGALLGWLGRVSARCLPASDSPGHSRGWAAFSGEGTVLFDPAQEPGF